MAAEWTGGGCAAAHRGIEGGGHHFVRRVQMSRHRDIDELASAAWFDFRASLASAAWFEFRTGLKGITKEGPKPPTQKVKARTQTYWRERRLEEEKKISSAIQIRKSNIPKVGGGVFYVGETPIPRNHMIVRYLGSQKSSGHKGYEFDINGAYRDAYDTNGRLILNTGEEVDTHDWTAEKWKGLGEEKWGVGWKSGDGCTNWARFINHGSREVTNCTMKNSKTREFPHAFSIYANRVIKPGEELLYNYGSDCQAVIDGHAS